MATYLAISMILVGSLLSAPVVSQLLQKYMNKLLGPILILVGMFLLEMLELRLRGCGLGDKTRARVESWGIGGAGLLGILFALSFCPVSAALFFGSLIPLSVNYGSSVFLPGLYGIGTGLPVFVFAVFIALGAGAVGKAFDRITQFEKWARRVTGVVFILVGVYFSLIHIFGFSL
jgi:threonine/homoserine/homoserine lactone efflux protein